MILTFFVAGMLMTYDPDLFFLTILGIFTFVRHYTGRRCEQ